MTSIPDTEELGMQTAR